MLYTKLLELGHQVTVVDLLKYDRITKSFIFAKKFYFIRDDVRKKFDKKTSKKNEFIIPLALVGAPYQNLKKKLKVQI